MRPCWRGFRQYRKGFFAPPSLEGTIVFPGFDGGAEWGGAAFDPETALFYVNSNEHAVDHQADREQRHGALQQQVRDLPSRGQERRRHRRRRSRTSPRRYTRDELAALIRQGTGRMPGFPDMGARNITDLVEYLMTGKDKATDPAIANDPSRLKYRSDGESIFLDPDGYPAITPPWGTLNAIDLNSGAIRWKIPFGEYPELAAKGLTNTGSDNYGGPVVTAGGLVFIGATNFDKKFRAFDKLTGKLLWETTLPAAGNATPAVYMLNGREYVVIVVRRREERRAVGQRDRRICIAGRGDEAIRYRCLTPAFSNRTISAIRSARISGLRFVESIQRR